MKILASFLALGFLFASRGLLACNSPLVLDLNGDGLLTTSAWWNPVWFDMNGDGEPERTGWPNPGTLEGILWIDLNRNGLADSGRELFGDATLLPTGERAENGFQALAVYDSLDYGGNSDGLIDHSDLVWPYLRIWHDVNLDGISQAAEVRPLGAWGILAISLRYELNGRVDGNMNVHQYVGTYFRKAQGRAGRSSLQPMAIEDIFFRVAPSAP